MIGETLLLEGGSEMYLNKSLLSFSSNLSGFLSKTFALKNILPATLGKVRFSLISLTISREVLHSLAVALRAILYRTFEPHQLQHQQHNHAFQAAQDQNTQFCRM